MTKHRFTVDFANHIFDNLNNEKAFKRVDTSKQGSEYHKTYESITTFAQEVIDNCPKGSANLLACATYGWMPTIIRDFDLSGSGTTYPIRRFKEAKNIEEASCIIQGMTSNGIIKNSWIGTSKFMHFLNPSIFPIWDTRVAEKFSEHCISWTLMTESRQERIKMPSAYHFANKKENYEKYTSFMLESLKNKYEWLGPLSDRFSQKYKYRPTDLRLLELMLFFK